MIEGDDHSNLLSCLILRMYIMLVRIFKCDIACQSIIDMGRKSSRGGLSVLSFDGGIPVLI